VTVPTGLISRGPWTRSSSRWARLGRACFLRDIPPMRLNRSSLSSRSDEEEAVALSSADGRDRADRTSWILLLRLLLLASFSPLPRESDRKADNAVSPDVVDDTTALVDDVVAGSRGSRCTACLSLFLALCLSVRSRKNATTAVPRRH